jgi:hypothetical protein
MPFKQIINVFNRELKSKTKDNLQKSIRGTILRDNL